MTGPEQRTAPGQGAAGRTGWRGDGQQPAGQEPGKQPGKPVRFADLTWTDLRQAAADGALVLVPLGTVEQHGPHLPVGTDTLAADFIAERISEATGALVLPTIPYSPSAGFRNYPGTLDIGSETLRRLLEDVCLALVRHGFRRIIFVNASEAAQPVIGQVAQLLRDRFGLVIGVVRPWRLGISLLGDVYADAVHEIGHGAEPETSALTQISPGLVRAERVGELPAGLVEFEGWRPVSATLAHVPGQPVGGTVYWDLERICPSGVFGRLGDFGPERGAAWVSRVTEFCIDFVREFDRNTATAAWARPPAAAPTRGGREAADPAPDPDPAPDSAPDPAVAALDRGPVRHR